VFFVTLLLEREQELTQLRAALTDADAGRGNAVSIGAGAGLGKTRLLQEVRRAGSGNEMKILTARATELEREFPFALVRQLFEPELAALSREEKASLLEGAGAATGALGLSSNAAATHDSFAVLHGLYWVTAGLAERHPLLLAIDDAHCADPASLAFLSFLLPRLEELPIALILASRPDEPDPANALGRLLADPTMRHLSPAPLSPEATTAFLRQELDHGPEPGFAETCHEASGGNPFLLRELVHSVSERRIEPVDREAPTVRELAPTRVTRMVMGRLNRLSPEAQKIASSLAVLGDDSDLLLVADLAGVELAVARRAADELRVGSIFERTASLRFVHPLVRNAVYSHIDVGERGRAHAQAAALLRGRHATPEQVATQLLASETRGDRDLVETLVAAGERALAGGAPRSAIAYLSRALREPPPEDLRPEVLEPLIVACFRAADHEAWAATEPDVKAELERDPHLRSRWAAPLTMTMAMGGRFEEAASLLADAVEVALEEGDIERAFQLEAQLRTLALVVPSAPEVDLSVYAEQIDPDSSAGRLAAAIEARAAVFATDRLRAASAAKRALGNDGVIFAEEPELIASSMAVLILISAEEVDAARHAVERASAIARERNATPDLARAFYLKGVVAWAHGNLVDAEVDLRQAMDLARLAEVPPLMLMFAGGFVEVLIERDDLNGAKSALEALGVAAGPMPDNPMFGFLQAFRGHLRFERGEMEAALEDFFVVSEQAERLGFGPGPSMTVMPFTVRALMATGQKEKAVELTDRSLPFARRWGAAGTESHVLRAVAMSREGAERIRVLEEAVAVTDGSPWRLERAHALLALGEVLRREGRRSEARAPLREVFDLARDCGAVRIAKRAHDELQASGEKVRRYAPTGVESLTPSERRVAELAAEGMTNRQIAQTLFVTLKTVESHLSGAYTKLDIDSRRQLADALG
jgi:DNA-binding CsgD family transcriptional regulator